MIAMIEDIFHPRLHTTLDVRDWFDAIHRAGWAFHPDDSVWLECDELYGLGFPHRDGDCQTATDGTIGHVMYRNRDGNPSCTPDEAQAFDRAMDLADDVCDRSGGDIYTIALASYRAHQNGEV